MSNDTFAANKAEIASLKCRVEALDAAREKKRQQLLKKIDTTEDQAMNAIAFAAIRSEGTESSTRINAILQQRPAPITGIPVMRLVNSRLETTGMEPVPFSAIAIASAQRTPNPAAAAAHAHAHAKAANQAEAMRGRWNQPPTPPAEPESWLKRLQTTAESATPGETKAAWLIAGVMAFCIAATAAISYFAPNN